MSEKTIDKLISFIEIHDEAKKLDITWYGGEPLLAFNSIQKLLNKIRSEIKIPIQQHSIITNGYYFDSKVVDFFNEYHLDYIQITLDGNKERHDSIRKLKGTGKGTYDTIIQNIDNILEKLPKTELHLRINIDRSNIQHFFDAINILGNRWKDKNIVIYPGILRIENETKTDNACNAMSRWEIAEFMYTIGTNKTLDFPIYPTLNCSKGCCATRVYSYIIGPEGEIYKCWNDVSNKESIIGYIDQKKLSNHSLLYNYLVGSKWYYEKIFMLVLSLIFKYFFIFWKK